MKRLLRKWLDRLIYHNCKHTHTFKFNLSKETEWYFENLRKGEHGSLQICGCYLCGKIWCKDYGA